MTAIMFDLPGIPPSPNKRLHYMQRHKSNQEWTLWAQQSVRNAINRAKVTELPWDRVHVQYIFHYPRVTLADPDNLVASAKPILDGVKGIVMPDDSAKYVHDLSATVEKRGGQPAGVVVVITRCTC